MATALERRLQKFVQNHFRKSRSHDARAETEDIRVIVRAGEMRRKNIPAKCRADASHFIGGHAHADARAADEDGEIRLFLLHGCARFLRKIRIIARRLIVRAAVRERYAARFQMRLERFLQRETTVIARYRNLHPIAAYSF